MVFHFLHRLERASCMSLVCKCWCEGIVQDPDTWRVILVTDVPAQKLSDCIASNSCRSRHAVIGDRVRVADGHSIRKRNGKATTPGEWLLEVEEIAIVVEIDDDSDRWFRLRDPRGLETKHYQNPQKFCFVEQVHTGGSVTQDDAASKYVRQGALPLKFSELDGIPDLGHVETLIVDESTDQYHKCPRVASLPDARYTQHCDWLWTKSCIVFGLRFPCLKKLRLSLAMLECERPDAQICRNIVFQWLLDLPKSLQHLKLEQGRFSRDGFSLCLPSSIPEWLPNMRGMDQFLSQHVGQDKVAMWPLTMREQIQVLDAIDASNSMQVLLRWFELLPNLQRVRCHACNFSASDLDLLCSRVPRSVSVLYLNLDITMPNVYPALAQWGCFAILRNHLRELFMSFDLPGEPFRGWSGFAEGMSMKSLAAHLAQVLPQTAVAAVDMKDFFNKEDMPYPHGWPDPMDKVFLPNSIEAWSMRSDCYRPLQL